MDLHRIDLRTYGGLMGLPLDISGDALSWAAADHLRWEVWRRGLCPQGTATRAVRARLSAAGFTEEAVTTATERALGDLLRLGDVAKLPAADGLRLAPVQPKLLELSPARLALVGSLPTRLLPEGVLAEGLCRHISPEQVELLASAQRHGAELWPIESWAEVARFTSSRYAPLASGKAPTAAAAWRALARWGSEGALPVSDLDAVQIVGPAPGDFLGRAFSEDRSRWGPPATPGTWLGRRRGYEETGHTHGVLVTVGADGSVLSRDLFGAEDFSWALVVRGNAMGAPEIVQVRQDQDPSRLTLQCTFPPPVQVWRALSLCGRSSGPWRWSIPEDGYPRAASLLASFGLSLQHTT